MENQPPLSPRPGPANAPNPMSQADERLWAMLVHLSAVPGSFVVIGSIVLPLVIWQIQKERSAFVDYHGKEAVNFNITMALALAVSFVLFLLLIGFLLVWIVGAVWLIFTIIAAIKANNGEYYRYPVTIRFIK